MRFKNEFRRPRKSARHLEADQSVSFATELDTLRTNQSGVAYIYGAMDLFISRFGIDDVVVILHDGREGTQIFRYGGKPISPDRTELVHAAPGVYCEPAVESNGDVDVLFERCRQELEDLRSVGDASTGVLSYHSYRATPGETLDDQPLALRPELPPDVDEVEEMEGPGPSNEDARLLISRVFVIVTLLNIPLTVFDVTGPVRYFLGLALGVAIPGWSIVGRLKLRYAALEVGLTIATSLAIIIVSAQTLITIHFWHLYVFELVLCFAVLPSLLIQSQWPVRSLVRRR